MTRRQLNGVRLAAVVVAVALYRTQPRAAFAIVVGVPVLLDVLTEPEAA